MDRNFKEFWEAVKPLLICIAAGFVLFVVLSVLLWFVLLLALGLV